MESKDENKASLKVIVMSQTDEGSVVDEMDSNASAEENGENSDCSRSNENIGMEQHFSEIEHMVHELKKGFMQVMQTLTVIQDDDITVKKELADMSETLESVQCYDFNMNELP
ncbi:uncharacterized protein LOC121369797 [Gigantopelta aegis]|uniref:uncharacterized protein LOC121369797 n=1 Tax=Gigantopelta aegis TaxID=1735272 RepID=UPI001B88A9CE|nr:uncharacterized protein LOC121369797 [Gigantopelta aegis]